MGLKFYAGKLTMPKHAGGKSLRMACGKSPQNRFRSKCLGSRRKSKTGKLKPLASETFTFHCAGVIAESRDISLHSVPAVPIEERIFHCLISQEGRAKGRLSASYGFPFFHHAR